jgi:tRNA pseudouridine38-40 synthase
MGGAHLMRNIRLTIEYDGTNYQGWQRQKNTQQTIQEIIEVALEQILQERIRLIASGRTDAGVHARAQVANFKTDKDIPSRKLKQALNSLVGDDIVITNVKDVDLGFHARFDIKSKTYRYAILNQRHPSALWRNFAYFVPYKLDIKLMRRAARVIVGRHNFSSFQATDKRPRGSIRMIKEIKITKKQKMIFIDIKADGFLYKMARNIIGTLIEIGRRKQSPIDIKKILAKRDRKFAGPTVPAHGLCLLRVKY